MNDGRIHGSLLKLLFCPVVLLLASCSGGSGTGLSAPPPRPPPPPPPPPTLVNAEGIWTGTAIQRCDVWRVQDLITDEGELFVYTPAGIYIGSVTEGPPFSVAAVNYEVAEIPLALVAQPDAYPLSITAVQPVSHLHLQWAEPGNFCSPGKIDLQYDDLFERPASLALIAGVYTDGDLTIAVNSDGVISGSDMNSCVLNGNVAVVHADRNYYSVVVEVDNCAASGSYEGAAFLRDAEAGGTNNEILLAAANSSHALWLTVDK